MFPVPLFIPAKRRARRTRRAPGPASLVLVSAEYPIEIEGAARLRFDREIDIAEFDGTQIIVRDGVNQGSVMNATGPVELSDPQTVTVYLVIIGPYAEANVLLSATGASGIVAADDGGKWPGVTDLALPFPPPPASAIVSVAHSDTDEDRVRVTANEQMANFADIDGAFEVSSDGVTWVAPELFGLPDTNVVDFMFPVVVTSATQWRVPNPAKWNFDAGGPLVAPFSGSIE
jgi:hypothetical protein